MRHLIASLVLVLSAALPVMAEDPGLARKDRIISVITLEDVEAILDAEGYTVTQINATEAFWVTAHKDDLMNFRFSGTSCKPEGCAGALISVSFGTEGPIDMARINEANRRWAPVKVSLSTRSSQPDYDVTRYLILVGGVTVANILADIDVTLNVARRAEEFFLP